MNLITNFVTKSFAKLGESRGCWKEFVDNIIVHLPIDYKGFRFHALFSS